MTPEDSRRHWEGLVGAFIINFGSIEATSCQWIYKLTNSQAERDKAIGLLLNKRLKLICDLIPKSGLSAEHQQRALELWGFIIRISKLRNIIAHSPFITNPQNQSGFIDIKEMKGVLDGSPIAVKVLTFEEVARAARRSAKVLKELLESF